MEQKRIDKRKTILIQDRAYFHSETHINLEATDGILKRFSILIFTPLILNH